MTKNLRQQKNKKHQEVEEEEKLSKLKIISFEFIFQL